MNTVYQESATVRALFTGYACLMVLVALSSLTGAWVCGAWVPATGQIRIVTLIGEHCLLLVAARFYPPGDELASITFSILVEAFALSTVVFTEIINALMAMLDGAERVVHHAGNFWTQFVMLVVAIYFVFNAIMVVSFVLSCVTLLIGVLCQLWGTRLSIQAHSLRASQAAEIDSVCAICLLQFAGADRAYSLSCGHLFHEVCLDAWLRDKESCPLCRASIFE